ncbi:MAG: large subunit ribosomal protein L22 [Flavobacteriales bacterium]|jgi:large subunit ribosomal protein L22
MGSRKHDRAEKLKEARKTQYFAKLNNCPTSPRKMRLVADIIRGKNVTEALNILKFTQKEAAGRMEKLLMSAVNNWEQKTEGSGGDIENLFVKSVTVDSARMLKRIQPAPQGRAHRIRKRSNHVTLFVDIKN